MMDHIGINISCEESLELYRLLGFREAQRIPRPERGDTIVFMEGHSALLEFFIKPCEKRMGGATYGIAHIAIAVPSLERAADQLRKEGYDVGDEKIFRGRRLFFVKDRDGQDVEVMEER